MAKIILPKFSKVTFIISGILFCIYLLIRILIKFNIYIYLFKIGVEVIIPIIIILVVALLIGAIAVLFYKNTKLKTLVVLTTTIFSFLILSYLSIFFLLTMDATYFEYTSADKKHNIVVNEGSFLLSGYGDIYEKTKCHIIGHFDLVTKFNEQWAVIDINNERYVRAYTKAIEKLLKSPAVFEINTGAISRGYRTGAYPDANMIDLIAKSGKPFVICSDTHNTGSIATNLENERELLEKKGYKYAKSLSEIL